MEIQSKLKKKSFTIVELACHQVRGFRNLYQELDDNVRLPGQSAGTLNNYARKRVTRNPTELSQDAQAKACRPG